MGEAFGNLLAFVDFGNLILEELVAALADLEDLRALSAPSYDRSVCAPGAVDGVSGLT